MARSPDGPNGWGFDSIVGQPEFRFNKPKSIKPDHINLNSGVWVVHEDQIDFNGVPTGKPGGAISNMQIESASAGAIPLDQGLFVNPTLRDIEFQVDVSIGSDQLTGIPVDIAFDNQMNLAALPNLATIFSPGSPAPFNGKDLVRVPPPGTLNCNQPTFLFAAIPNSNQGGGVVDVIKMESGFLRFDTNPFQPGTQSIPVPGVNVVMDYFRQ